MHRIYVHESPMTFHLQNDEMSYIISVGPEGLPEQLYCGKRLHDRECFDHLRCKGLPFGVALTMGKGYDAEEVMRLEYPAYGSSDYRQGAVSILQENGSRMAAFVYESYEILQGKPQLQELPAIYTENPEEASTLVIRLLDNAAGVRCELYYTIFSLGGAVARSVRFQNIGTQTLYLERAMSLCLDLPDSDYEWISLDGSWGRERTPHTAHLTTGYQGVESIRGNSSHQHNPFIALKRPHTSEHSGEALGFSLVYSGNFLAQIQVDNTGFSRVLMGINPTWFSWELTPGDTFQTPEAVMVYSGHGLNGMSQCFHRLYRTRLARGAWRDKARPILINNWEATQFDFNEDLIVQIARKAGECGIEMFVLDDGWFGARRSDHAGLGDWVPARDILPNGIKGLSEKVNALGMKFGLWIEPEMVNPDSDLFREHPDWILRTPGRRETQQRNQCVLDFARPEVVDYIYEMLAKILHESKIDYVKWDMNRSITECYSAAFPPHRQGEIFHRYILGVYRLYEMLIAEFPDILFESCASGGGRFDPGMLYYAPQTWTSDDTDAYERLKIQYGTSFVYPVSSMGSHVSAAPNHQTGRNASIQTRADVAYFGTFGYELDLNTLSEKEQQDVVRFTAFMKEHRQLIQFGTFYRLASPFEENDAGWMVVSEDRTEAIVGWYHALNEVNVTGKRLKLAGLNPDIVYNMQVPSDAAEKDAVRDIGSFYGDDLMNAGIASRPDRPVIFDFAFPVGDFTSEIFLLKAADEN
ncbi:MAG: alpha-galactosidase [Clostridia bacterium]|nr:alpha-galactosidase [Clostridia bacterium]